MFGRNRVTLIFVLGVLAGAGKVATAATVPHNWLNSAVPLDVDGSLFGRGGAGFHFNICSHGEAFVEFSNAPASPGEDLYLLLTNGSGGVVANITHGNVTLPAQQHEAPGSGHTTPSSSAPVQFFAFIRFHASTHPSSDAQPPQASTLYYLAVHDNCCRNHTACAARQWIAGASFCTTQGTCAACQACALLEHPTDGQCPQACTTIPSMDLEGKGIAVLPHGYSFPPEVESLNLAHNLLQEVPRALRDLTHLKHLDMSGNPLDRVLRSLDGLKAGDPIPALTRHLPCSLQTFAARLVGDPWVCRMETLVANGTTANAPSCAGAGHPMEGGVAHVWTCYLTAAGEQAYVNQHNGTGDNGNDSQDDSSASTSTQSTSLARLVFFIEVPITVLAVTVGLALFLNRKMGREEKSFRIFIALFLSALAVGLYGGFVAFELFSDKFHDGYTCNSNRSSSNNNSNNNTSNISDEAAGTRSECSSWHVVNHGWLGVDALRNCSTLFCVITALLCFHAWWLSLSFVLDRERARAHPGLLPCCQRGAEKHSGGQPGEHVDGKLLQHLILLWVLKLILGEAVQLTVLSVYAAAMYALEVRSVLKNAHNDLFVFTLVAVVTSCVVTLCMIVRYCCALCTMRSATAATAPATGRRSGCWSCCLGTHRRVYLNEDHSRSSRSMLLHSVSRETLLDKRMPLDNNESCNVVVQQALPRNLAVDAVLCAVQPEGGPRDRLAGKLWQAAGDSLQQECRALWRIRGPLYSGCARITGPGGLGHPGHLKAIVHVALWERGMVCCASATRATVLRHAVFQALLLAGKRNDITSIGIPLMGTAKRRLLPKLTAAEAAREVLVAVLLAVRLRLLGGIRRVVVFHDKAKRARSFVRVANAYKRAFASGPTGNLLLPPMAGSGEDMHLEHEHDIPVELSHVWYWHSPETRATREEWVPYDWEQQQQLELARAKVDTNEVLVAGTHKGKPSASTKTPAGAACATYRVNVRLMEQHNTVSGHMRNVKRTARSAGAVLPLPFQEAREKALRRLEASLTFVSGARVASHCVNKNTGKLRVFPHDVEHNARLMRHPTFAQHMRSKGCHARLEGGDLLIEYALDDDFLALQGLAVRLREEIMIPETWVSVQAGSGSHLHDVPTASSEFRSVAKLVRDRGLDGGDISIARIQRIQNRTLWSQYFHKRASILESRGGVAGLNEQHLFHGTRTTKPDVIIRDNFDHRVSRNGCMYGRAAYFAERSSYAHLYAYSVPNTRNQRQMFLARVAAGKVRNLGTERRTSLTKPEDGFDSVGALVRNNDHAIMVYDTHQAYPDYLITYNAAPTSA